MPIVVTGSMNGSKPLVAERTHQHFAAQAVVLGSVVLGLVPLLWFAHAARHLRLTTLGFLQYLAPSCTFFLGIFVFHEPFRRAQMTTFALIWVALVIFTADAVARWRGAQPSALEPVEM